MYQFPGSLGYDTIKWYIVLICINWGSWICTWMFIGHLCFFIKLLVCVRVPFSFPIFMMFVLRIFKISLCMWINTLLYYILIFYFPRLSFFFQFCSWWFLNFFLLLLYGNVKFKLCNKMYPSFASEIWKSCILLCASKGFPSHKIVKFLLTFSSRHFMVLFFAIWIDHTKYWQRCKAS